MSGLPVLDAQGRPVDQVRLVGLTARGFHGVLEQERRDGQDFAVDVVLHLDTRAAAASDRLADTVDYAALGVALAQILRGDPVDLLERLAERLARRCLLDERVVAVDVALHKPSAPIPETFDDVVVAIRRTRDVVWLRPAVPVSAVLALGANLGDRAAVLQSAVNALSAVPGVRVDRVSPVFETAPVGGPEQPDYLNGVVLVTTTLTPLDLLVACQRVEQDHGRTRRVRWGARTLDIDVIVYGDVSASTGRLDLPHPRAWRRAFVLAPWAAVDPQATLAIPAVRRVVDLLAESPDREGVRLRPDLTLEVPA